MAKVKCKYCKSSIDKSSAINPSSRTFFCNEECLNLYKKSDEYQMDLLYRNLLQYYENNDAFLILKQQVDKAMRENKMKYSGINATLNYFTNILERSYNSDYGIWQFLTYYDEAKRYMRNKIALRRQIKGVNDDDMVDECLYMDNPKRSNKSKIDPIEINEL